MSHDNENLFWNKTIRDYKKKYKPEIVNTFLGILFKWEFQMLLGVGAISEEAVKSDGYVVRDKQDNLLYEGRDRQMAESIKEESKSNKLERGSNLYSSYVDYKERLTRAI